MSESREERLARIRAVLEAKDTEIEVSVAEVSGAWCRDGAFRALTLDDLRWLAAEVSTEREYRVEWNRLDLLPQETAWTPRDGNVTYDNAAEAHEQAQSYRDAQKLTAHGVHPTSRWMIPTHEFRVVSAPVQVWTPEEEGP